MTTRTHRIGGVPTLGQGDATLPLTNPATGATVADIAVGDAGDAQRAVGAARKAAGDWQRAPVGERAAVLHALASAAEAHPCPPAS